MVVGIVAPADIDRGDLPTDRADLCIDDQSAGLQVKPDREVRRYAGATALLRFGTAALFGIARDIERQLRDALLVLAAGGGTRFHRARSWRPAKGLARGAGLRFGGVQDRLLLRRRPIRTHAAWPRRNHAANHVGAARQLELRPRAEGAESATLRSADMDRSAFSVSLVPSGDGEIAQRPRLGSAPFPPAPQPASQAPPRPWAATNRKR